MPRFGVCTAYSNADVVRGAGFDFIEENVYTLFQGDKADADYARRDLSGCSVPVLSGNGMVPANPALKLTGPGIDPGRLGDYVTRTFARAAATSMRTIVLGSAGARNVPDGFDRQMAERQMLDFLGMVAPIAEKHGLTVVLEPLSRRECNIVNSVAEAMGYVREVNHPNLRCMVDSYHFWTDEEPLENLRAAMPWIGHVHVADREGRVAPGQSGKSDYRGMFSVLKQGGYDGPISSECTGFTDIAGTGPGVLAFLKRQWDEA